MRFTKMLDNIAPHMHQVEKFDDFLKMTVCAFSMGKMEAEYEQIIKRYSKEDVKQFGEALGALFLDYEDFSKDGAWKDVLGASFEEAGNSNARMGQFFTPDAICDLMAKVSENETGNELTICDPACGSSRNLIAHCRLKPENRMNCFYTGSDLDYRCVLMSVINFVMYGMRGVVIHMNAISLEVYRGFRIWLPETGMFVQPLSKEQCCPYIYEPKETDTEISIPEIIKVSQSQLTLF